MWKGKETFLQKYVKSFTQIKIYNLKFSVIKKERQTMKELGTQKKLEKEQKKEVWKKKNEKQKLMK